MEDVKTIYIGETDSTNRFMHEYVGEEGRRMTFAVAEGQTAGRGQGTNTWESETGKNLLFSVKTYPKGLAATRQYAMLEAGALAVCRALRHYAGEIAVKWPNDVYWRDRKISGTLSECTIKRGMVGSCIIGTGINVNQEVFRSSAPNPVSLKQITGKDIDREEVLGLFTKYFGDYIERIDEGDYDALHAEYEAGLYRRTGTFGFRDAGGTFSASIEGVDPSGPIRLLKADGSTGKYAFKEVEFII